MKKLLKWLLSPLVWRYLRMPGRSYQGRFVGLTEPERELRDNLKWHVEQLSVEIGDRNHHTPGALRRAELYVSTHLWANGYDLSTQGFEFGGLPMSNVIAELKGQGPRANEVLVIGAHYDTLKGSPGADDNASGIAALLELSRLLRHVKLGRTVRFVAFANEEDGAWESMGSYHYAKALKARREKVVGMLALEMLGYYNDDVGSQKYPFPFNMFYPDRGNFVGFVGNYMSVELVRRCVGTFRRNVLFPCEGAAPPNLFSDINRSDHWAFWQMGYRGLMVTDTSNFRYPFVHTPDDLPDKLDFEKMARVVDGLRQVIIDLAR